MRHSRLANLPERAAAGAFILNSGLTKLQADKESAGSIHGMASGTYPVLEQVPPEGFTKGLGMAECAIGGALLFPLIGDGLAGFSLSAFAAGLLGLYLKTPGLRQEDGIRPSQQGTAFAKDVWLLGIGLSLMGHSVGARRQSRKLDKARGGSSKVAKAAKVAAGAKAAKGAAKAAKGGTKATEKVSKGIGAAKLAKSATSALVPNRD